MIFGKGCLAAMVLLTGNAQANVVYSDDFQHTTAGAEWSSTSTQPWGIQTAPDGSGTRNFLGFFGGNDVTTLAVTGISGDATRIKLEFDAYLIWSWDGNDTRQINNTPLGPDIFGFRNDGGEEQSWTFSHSIANQSYCDPGVVSCIPTTGAVERYTLGYHFGIAPLDEDKLTTTNAPMDSVYHFVWEGLHTGPSATFEFFSRNLQVRPDLAFQYQDEAWGLDNVRVSAFNASVVLEPSSEWLMLLGLVIMLAVARRRSSPEGTFT